MQSNWFQVSVNYSEWKHGCDMWDSCCLSRGFQSVRTPCYTSNTRSASRTASDAHIRSIQTRMMTLRCSMWDQEPFFFLPVFAPIASLLLWDYCLSFLSCSLASLNNRLFKQCTVEHCLTSSCLFHHFLLPCFPSPLHCPCETIGRCNI